MPLNTNDLRSDSRANADIIIHMHYASCQIADNHFFRRFTDRDCETPQQDVLINYAYVSVMQEISQKPIFSPFSQKAGDYQRLNPN
jgi:hypothetical protein